jgi:hypothetical protein
MNTRRGLGKGLGCGYRNIAPMDSHIHSLSAKGVKTQVIIQKKRHDVNGNPVYDVLVPTSDGKITGLRKLKDKGRYSFSSYNKEDYLKNYAFKGKKIDIVDLSAKYNYKTERGEVDVETDANDFVYSSKYNTKSVNSTSVLDEVKALASEFDMNPYARAYFNEFDSSYVLYGNRGMKSQIAYFLTNVKAKTPAQKKAKERLLKILKDDTLKAKGYKLSSEEKRILAKDPPYVKTFRKTFHKLANKENWKMPPKEFVGNFGEAEQVKQSYIWFLGGAEMEQMPDGKYKVTSKGYYHYIGA